MCVLEGGGDVCVMQDVVVVGDDCGGLDDGVDVGDGVIVIIVVVVVDVVVVDGVVGVVVVVVIVGVVALLLLLAAVAAMVLCVGVAI